MNNQTSKLEILTGLSVIGLSIFFLIFGLKQANITGGGQYYPLRANFSNIGGLNIGADVKLSGVKIGTISKTSLNPETYEAEITLLINRDITVPSDSVIKIASDGLLGGQHLTIEAGADSDPLSPEDYFEYTQSSVSLIDLLSRAVFSAN